MITDPTHIPNHDVHPRPISDGGNGHGNMVMNWFSDTAEGNPHMSGGDITRDKRKLAFQTGENDSDADASTCVPAFPTAWKDGDAVGTDAIRVCYRYSGPAGGATAPDVLARRRRASPATRATASTSSPSRHFAGDCTTGRRDADARRC